MKPLRYYWFRVTGQTRRAGGIKAARTRKANRAGLRDSACGNNLTVTTSNAVGSCNGLWTVTYGPTPSPDAADAPASGGSSQETRGPNPENTPVRVPTDLNGDCGATRVAREAEHGPGVIPQTGLREKCEAKAESGGSHGGEAPSGVVAAAQPEAGKAAAGGNAYADAGCFSVRVPTALVPRRSGGGE